MKQYPLKYSSFKILFVFVFVLAFSNKLSANTIHTNTNLITISFSINNLNDEDTEVIEGINIDLCEEEKEEKEEEEFSNDFFVTFQDKNIFIKDGISSNQRFNAYLFSSERKRFYILYCQLKTHL